LKYVHFQLLWLSLLFPCSFHLPIFGTEEKKVEHINIWSLFIKSLSVYSETTRNCCWNNSRRL